MLSKDDIAGCKAPQGIIKRNLRTLSKSTNLPSSTQLFSRVIPAANKDLGAMVIYGVRPIY